MRKIFYLAVFGVILIFSTPALFAQRGTTPPQGTTSSATVEVRLASPLPRNSTWGRELDRLAAEWHRITNGNVRLTVIHDGREGGEEQMLQSLRTNTIQGAIFTSFGLSQINPAIMTVSIPFLIRNDRELEIVMREIQGDLEARFNRSNFHLLALSRSGFVNIFSRDPVLTPDDLRRQPIASNAEADRINRAFSAMGFRIEQTDWTDIGPKLNSGAVRAIYLNPSAVAPLNIHRQLGHMLSIDVAPVLGGLVMNQVIWNRIGNINSTYPSQLQATTRRLISQFDSTLPRMTREAIDTMTRGGLTINRPSPAQEQLWHNEIERVLPSLLANGTFDRELYQRINGILARTRGGR